MDKMETSNNPLISVVLPTHNRANKLPISIQSLINQTYKNIEIIIIDDVSHDATPDVINALTKEHKNIRAIRTKTNVGPGGAYNLGIESAQGDFIAIMDDDDITVPQRLELQLNEFLLKPELDLVFSSIEWVDENSQVFHSSPKLLIRNGFPQSSYEIFKLLYLYGLGIPNQTIMARKRLWRRFIYPIDPKGTSEWILLMQIAASDVKMKGMPIPLVKVYKGKGKESVTADPRSKVFPKYLEAFNLINQWLEKEQRYDLLRFQHKARSNLFLRESRHYIGPKGIWYVSKGLFAAPTNQKVWQEIFRYPKKIVINVRHS
jgi:glycosyltransferase involved in cell wall biosynthesis